MWVYNYITLIIWAVYLSAFEFRIVRADVKARRENRLVNPEYKTLTHLRYVSGIVGIAILGIFNLVAQLLFGNSVGLTYASNIVTGLLVPIMNWLVFSIMAKHLISKAKREQLKEAVDQEK